MLIKKFRLNFNFKDKKNLFLIFINLAPIFLILITSLLSGSKIRTMWMTPFYLFFGTLVLYNFKKNLNLKRIKIFLITFFVIFLFSPITYGYISIIKTDKRTDYPGRQIAKKTQERWDNEFETEINIVLGNEWSAGNLSYHLKTRPVWNGNIDKKKLSNLNQFLCIDDICIGNK